MVDFHNLADGSRVGGIGQGHLRQPDQRLWPLALRALFGSRSRHNDIYGSLAMHNGILSRFCRLWLDLYDYPEDITEDFYGTEADVRRMRQESQDVQGFKLRVCTQNLWLIPCVSLFLEARLQGFCEQMFSSDIDVLALQEVWHGRERDYIRRKALEAGLRYSRHFEPGCGVPLLGPRGGGTGLMLLSRYPITESIYKRFSVNGYPWKLQHMDYMAAKGVGLARLHTPAGGVDVFVTHLHAGYSCSSSESQDEYLPHRLAQGFELAYFIRTMSRHPLTLLLGDLNSPPSSLVYQLQRSVAGLADACTQRHPGNPGHTVQVSDNCFSSKQPPACIDYILYGDVGRLPTAFGLTPSDVQWSTTRNGCTVQRMTCPCPPARSYLRRRKNQSTHGQAASTSHAEPVINVSDHHGLVAEFVAMDINQDSVPTLPQLSDAGPVELSMPPGLILMRLLAELRGAVERATDMRRQHLSRGKVAVVLWLALLAATASPACESMVTRVGVMLAASITSVGATLTWMIQWFAAKEEVQSLLEVYKSAKNFADHLPMEESFPDPGFDHVNTSYLDGFSN